MSIRVLSSLLLLSVTAAGCQRGTTATADSAAPRGVSPDAVVAEFDGQKVTLAELDKSVSGRMADVRHQEYEVRQQGLDKLIEDRLIDKAAAARGVTREALLKAEVDDKAQPPDPAELEALYEQYKARFAGRTREESIAFIGAQVGRQARAQREREYRESLRKAANVKIALEEPRTTVSIPADAPVLGPADAKVTMIEFLDYGCGYCHRAEPVVEELLKRYEGKIRFVHRDFPLSPDGPTVTAARAARCAGEMGKFWEYHRVLMTKRMPFDKDSLTVEARALGLDTAAFGSCLASDKYDASISSSAEEGSDIGVSATPTFFINGRRVPGAMPIEHFVEIIEAELAAKG